MLSHLVLSVILRLNSRILKREFLVLYLPLLILHVFLNIINELGCWLAKESNAASSALTELLTDVDSVHHTTLKNRAAIDFLLLAQGHGCEDFDGMCCMTLSYHSESIHKCIQELKEASGELQQNQGWDPFGLFSWLGSFNFGPCVKHLVGLSIMGLRVLLMIMLCLPCVFSCIQGLVNQNIKQVMLVQTHTVQSLHFLVNKGAGEMLGKKTKYAW